MKPKHVCFIIFLIFLSCKTSPPTLATLPTEIKSIPKDTFILEKEEDFENIEKSYIILIKSNFGRRSNNKDCNCSELEEKYILFSRKNKSYIQKVVETAVYYPVKLKSNDIINLYIDTFDEIKTERVYHFSDQEGNGIFVSHRTHLRYIFVAENKRPVTISYYEDDFKECEYNDINFSYRYNKKLKLFKIDSLFNSEIDNLNKQDAFIFKQCRKN